MDLSGIGSLYTDQMSQAASNASGDNLKAKLNNSSNATDDELMEVCKEFEAYFTEQVYKEMLKTVPKHEGEKTSALVDYYKDMTVSQIAKDTANEGNGVGLAQSLYEQMRRNYEQ